MRALKDLFEDLSVRTSGNHPTSAECGRARGVRKRKVEAMMSCTVEEFIRPYPEAYTFGWSLLCLLPRAFKRT